MEFSGCPTNALSARLFGMSDPNPAPNDTHRMLEELNTLSGRLKEIEKELQRTLERIGKLVQELPPKDP